MNEHEKNFQTYNYTARAQVQTSTKVDPMKD